MARHNWWLLHIRRRYYYSPISVASAVEGLTLIPRFSHIPTIPIVITIITGLFFIQQFGSKFIGRFFGPVMLVWFLTLGVMGLIGLSHDYSVLKALNPYYGIKLLINHPGGFWVLSSVFYVRPEPKHCTPIWGIAAVITFVVVGFCKNNVGA